MLRVQIVDDEALAAERLVRLCDRLDDVAVVGVAADGKAALRGIEELDPDVVLLDIAMPGMDGVALARALAAREDQPAIVFVTAHDGFAVTAFELAATDYLLKPVSLARLGQALARAGAAHPRRAGAPRYLTEIWAPTGREMVRVGVETIHAVEAERDYVRLHAGGHAHLLRLTLRELEQRLDPGRFLRVHRSWIVALDRIRELTRDSGGGWTMLLSTGRRVPVGRSFRSTVRKLTARPA